MLSKERSVISCNEFNEFLSFYGHPQIHHGNHVITTLTQQPELFSGIVTLLERGLLQNIRKVFSVLLSGMLIYCKGMKGSLAATTVAARIEGALIL